MTSTQTRIDLDASTAEELADLLRSATYQASIIVETNGPRFIVKIDSGGWTPGLPAAIQGVPSVT